MKTWVALFRGINVGGRHLLPMKLLKEGMGSLGCENVKSYIQSGNLVFQYADEIEKMPALLSDWVQQHHGFAPAVMILSPEEISAAIKNNPYDPEAGKTLMMYFLERPAHEPNWEKLHSLKSPTEQCQLSGKVFYLWAPDGIGRSKMAAQVEKCLAVPATARNLNTMNKIRQMLTPGDPE